MIDTIAPVPLAETSFAVRHWIRTGVLATLAFWTAIGLAVFYDDNYYPVVPGHVYRSAQPTNDRLQLYRERDGIRSVVNLRGEWPESDWYREEIDSAKRLGLSHYDINLCTHQLAPLPELRKLVQTLDECPKPVLLHCRQGADRTSLASAIYQMLYRGKGLDESLNEYRLMYGHTGLAWGRHLPHLFEIYKSWLERNGREHSPTEFRQWLAAETTLGYFGASIEVTGFPLTASVGRTIEFVAEVTNVSRYPWELAGQSRSGIHLNVMARYESEESSEDVAVGKPTVTRVEPGQTVTFQISLPPFHQTGRVAISLDMADGYDISFSRMGSSSWTSDVLIRSDAPLSTASSLR